MEPQECELGEGKDFACFANCSVPRTMSGTPQAFTKYMLNE